MGIGTSTPDPSSVLDLKSTDKGISLPNVALTAQNDAATISNPKKGLLVFKPGETSLPEGFYYNAGNATTPDWKRLEKSNNTEGITTVKIPFGSTDINKTLVLNSIEVRYNPSTRRAQIRSAIGSSINYNIFIMENWKWGEGGSDTYNNIYQGNNNCTATTSFTDICSSTTINNTGTKSEFNDFWIYTGNTTYHYYLSVVGGTNASLVLEQF